jgi:aspartyl-tRNA synthetase
LPFRNKTTEGVSLVCYKVYWGIAYNESQGYVDVSMVQDQWRKGLTQEDNSHNTQPLHRGISLETQDILLVSFPSSDLVEDTTHKDIIRQMITSSHKLIHRTANNLQMIQNIPNINFRHWRKKPLHSHRFFPRDHPVRIRRHARNTNLRTFTGDRRSARWSGHLEIES